MSVELMMPSNHLIFCCPLLLSVFLRIRGFSSESTLCFRWPKHWNFSISPCNECSGLISIRIDWFDLLAVQGTSMSLPNLIPVRMAISKKQKKSRNNKCWRGCGEKGTFPQCWWECKLVQPLWRIVWRFHKKLKIKLPYDPEIPHLDIHPKKM